MLKRERCHGDVLSQKGVNWCSGKALDLGQEVPGSNLSWVVGRCGLEQLSHISTAPEVRIIK